MEIIAVLKSALTILIPILFAATGGLFPALAGMLNISLEGLLLMGAFSSLAVFFHTGNIFLSAAAAVCAAMLLSVLHAFTVFKLRANVFITGLAVNLLSSGLCIVLSDKFFNTRGVITAQFTGNSVLNSGDLTSWYLVIGLVFLVIVHISIYRTPFGYRLRACDKNHEALSSLGLSPKTYRIAALLISGFFCGIGGSFLSLNLGVFVPGMAAGRGWIALVVIFLGGRKPFGLLAAVFIFAVAESLSNNAQGFLKIPADFILVFPYILTLIAMIAVSVFPKKMGIDNK